MTLSFNKFIIAGTSNEGVDIRCTVCGRSETADCLRLDEATEWAGQHVCAELRTT